MSHVVRCGVALRRMLGRCRSLANPPRRAGHPAVVLRMDTKRIAEAVDALRLAGNTVEVMPGAAHVYRVDGKDAVTGRVVLAMPIRLGLMDPPSRAR